jgi:hypothetical protein
MQQEKEAYASEVTDASQGVHVCHATETGIWLQNQFKAEFKTLMRRHSAIGGLAACFFSSQHCILQTQSKASSRLLEPFKEIS